MKSDIQWVLFDLGGVLIQLGDMTSLFADAAAGKREEELWDLWLTSDLPKRMDSGQFETDEFINLWLAEQNISLSHDAYKNVFASFIHDAYPGALELVQDTAQKVKVGCLSNSNPCHWERMGTFDFHKLFDVHVVSHLVGCCKPDAAIYAEAEQLTGAKGHKILFLDDNRLNVEAARRAGWQAACIKGPQEARAMLQKYHILP